MTTNYPKNFGAMLSAFLAGWEANKATVDYQHMGIKIDAETGRKTTIHGAWTSCRSLKELIGAASKWSVWDNYLTPQRFSRWETRVSEETGSEDIVTSDHSASILDKIYTDTDPEDGRADTLDLLPRFKKMQDELEVDGRSAVWINCSGRGFHSYTYLDQPVDVRQGQLLQDILGYTFGLELDFWAPITRARMMRLPGSKNSRTGTWVLCVGRNMTLGGLRRAMGSELVDGLHWDYPARIPPSRILSFHPGEMVLAEHREKKRERARAKIRKGMERKVSEALPLLNQGKTWAEIALVLGYKHERYIRYWVERFQ